MPDAALAEESTDKMRGQGMKKKQGKMFKGASKHKLAQECFPYVRRVGKTE